MASFRITLDPMGAVVAGDSEDDAAIALISHLMDKYELSFSELEYRMVFPLSNPAFDSLRVDEVLDNVAPR